ncbi:MAG: cupin domain-containing protein [Pseudomonadota bacterium]
MLGMKKREIGQREATDEFGVSVSHEQMENGELRFRLNSRDGSAYIRTHAGKTDGGRSSGWQNAHYHKHSKETYIVQSGLLILATRDGQHVLYQSFAPGEAVSTQPYVSHNVFLREDTVVHTVKTGSDQTNDWHADLDLDAETKALSEEAAMGKVQESSKTKELDPRYVPYVNMYNNADNIIWRMPAFLTGGVTLLIGVAVGLLGDKEGTASALVWGSVLAASALIFFLGAYGLWRLRIHQHLIGNELRGMEGEGYFLARETTKASFRLPRAPAVYVFVFFCLSGALAWASANVFSGNERLYEILNIPQTPTE